MITEEELARELEHSDSNEEDSQEISLEAEEKLLKDEPECEYKLLKYGIVQIKLQKNLV